MPTPSASRAASLLSALLLGCAEVSDPLPPPDVLVLVPDSGAASLGVFPVEALDAGEEVPLPAGGTPAGVATRSGLAVVPLGSLDGVVVLDLQTGGVVREVAYAPGSDPAAVAFASDSVIFVVLAGQGRLGRVSIPSGDTLSVPVGTDPRGVVFTRGRLFVLNANSAPCPTAPDRCALGPSWITVLDPATLGIAAQAESVALPGAINATAATVGNDGQLYVVATGDFSAPEGRLHIVDPVDRVELASFGGLGSRPGPPAALEGRILIASRTEGLLEFDARAREFTRGAGDGIPVLGAVGAAVGEDGRVWVAREVGCPVAPGLLTVLRPDLTPLREVPIGACPTAAVLGLLPIGP
jgi:streptogramin lyase